MIRHRTLGAVSTVAVVALAVSACGGGSGGSSDNKKAAFNAAVGKVFNPSDVKGGTLRFAVSQDWDSVDPGDTYYALSWNFLRLYGRTLTMFASAPGAAGAKLVPDLADSLGKSSADGKTWTYHLRKGVRYEDGTFVTSMDVKYAVERSLDKAVFPDGPTYFNDFLDLQGYTSPYHDKDPKKLGLKAIETPDPQTIIFHLKKPFAGFDYFAMLPATVPVKPSVDTGVNYKQHVLSSGPYMFAHYTLGKQMTLIRNTEWDPATDPNRKALPSQIEVQLNVNATDLDNRLLSGDLDVDIAGSGVQAAAQGRILADPALKANADSALVARLWFTSINGEVPPLDNVHCRRAVEYAADKVAYQNAYGGKTGGEIATNLMPPVIPGAEKFDRYPAGPDGKPDVAKAKDELAQCGQPNGFATNMSFRGDRPKEKATAEALQQSLAKVNINLTLRPFPTSDYFKLYAGKPAYAKANKLGLMTNGWGADWPDGFGFLSQIVDSRVIRDTGGANNTSVRDPAVDALVDKAVTTSDVTAREKVWVDVDKQVMDDAYILPGIWSKGLLYRPPHLTNVFVSDGFQMYDYLALGVTQ